MIGNDVFVNRVNFLDSLIRNNKGLIFILPSVLGSITQIFALISIDNNVSYLKFFSISQIIPDSLYFLIVIITTVFFDLIICYFFGNYILKFSGKSHIG